MNRRERLRAYWEARIPPFESCVLSDALRFINRGQDPPLFGLRTLRRKAASGELPALGGPDRSHSHYRVLRSDLIEFLCDLDVITGAEPPDPRPRPERRREQRQERKTKPLRRGPGRSDSGQGSLF